MSLELFGEKCLSPVIITYLACLNPAVFFLTSSSRGFKVLASNGGLGGFLNKFLVLFIFGVMIENDD